MNNKLKFGDKIRIKPFGSDWEEVIVIRQRYLEVHFIDKDSLRLAIDLRFVPMKRGWKK